MSMFQLKWLRKLVRRNTRPIEHRHAFAWRDRLSIAYALVAWNAFGMVCYMAYSGRNDWAKFHGLKSAEEQRLSSCELCAENGVVIARSFHIHSVAIIAQQWAKTLKIEKAKVIQFSGFSKVNEFEIDNTVSDGGDGDGELIGDSKA